jgi:type I restriction enzyme S subunit
MNWQPTKLSEFLTERDGRIKYESANQLGLQRIKKIDFSGNIHLDAETDTKTDMIRVKSGDLVISGINAAKGAIAVHAEDDDVLATIHYSAYEFNPDRISVDFLKWFFRSSEFSDLLREQIPGGIKTELKPKHILPLQVKLPKLSEQITVAERLNRFRFEQLKLEHEITHQQSLLAKLKQAILQEAIQGKLTADWRAARPNVEPASQLLHRIQAEKDRLIAAKKLRPEKPLPKITPAEIPFEIPKGWEWCRFADVQTGSDAGCSPKCEERPVSGEEWGILKVSATSGALFRQDENKFFQADTPDALDAALQEGDFILSRANTKELAGNSVLVEGLTLNLLLSDKTIRFRIFNEISSRYANLVNKAAFVRAHFIRHATGASPSMKNLSRDSITSHPFPLPPLAEQAAIVQRVEALMTTCRALEAEIEHARTHADHLLQAVLKEAFAPASS